MAGDGERKGGRAWLGAEPCGPDTVPARCDCRTAVCRAYKGMIASGTPTSDALWAAIRVYRYHHPEAAPAHAQETVETWVFSGPLH